MSSEQLSETDTFTKKLTLQMDIDRERLQEWLICRMTRDHRCKNVNHSITSIRNFENFLNDETGFDAYFRVPEQRDFSIKAFLNSYCDEHQVTLTHDEIVKFGTLKSTSLETVRALNQTLSEEVKEMYHELFKSKFLEVTKIEDEYVFDADSYVPGEFAVACDLYNNEGVKMIPLFEMDGAPNIGSAKCNLLNRINGTFTASTHDVIKDASKKLIETFAMEQALESSLYVKTLDSHWEQLTRDLMDDFIEGRQEYIATIEPRKDKVFGNDEKFVINFPSIPSGMIEFLFDEKIEALFEGLHNGTCKHFKAHFSSDVRNNIICSPQENTHNIRVSFKRE